MSHRKQSKKSRKSAVALMMIAGGLAVAALSISVAVYAQQPPPKTTIGTPTGTGLVAPSSGGMVGGTVGNLPRGGTQGANPGGAVDAFIPKGGTQGANPGGAVDAFNKGTGAFSCAAGEHCGPTGDKPQKDKAAPPASP